MEEEDFSKLPLEEQCVHKLWKVRFRAYELAAQLFSQTEEKSPEWNKYNGLIKKFVADSNAPAQEKACVAVLAYVENCGAAGKTTADVVSAIVQKCVAAQKAKTRELASQIILMYIEIEKQDVVMEELVKGTESKNPKIAAACIHIIIDALREFGQKVISPAKLIKRVLALLEDRDKSIRDEAKLLILEMYRWLGPALNPHLSNLKPSTVSEIKPELAKIEGVAKPTRYLRSQQAKNTQAVGGDFVDDADGSVVDAEENREEVDPYELLDPVDILGQLPKSFYPLLESKKWSERKESLDALEKILEVSPKLENADYGDLVRTLKKVVAKDSNVVVVGVAIKCITGLANGLKRKFHPYAPLVMVTLFEKFKEKKQNVVVALREAVDAVFVSTSIEQLLEDLIVLLDNKNPSIKAETISFLNRCFCKSTPTILNKKLLKPLSKSLQKCLGDQDPTVRENATQAIGTAMKVVGEKNILPLIGEIDAPKMAKIKEYYVKAEVVAVKQPKATPKHSSAESSKSKSSGSDKTTGASTKVRPKATESNPVAKPKKAASPLAVNLDRSVALSKVKSLLPEEVVNNYMSQDDQARLDALNEIRETTLKIAPSDETSQILLNAICTDGTETNLDVLNVKLDIISHVVNTMPLAEEGIRVAVPDILLGMGSIETERTASAVIQSILDIVSTSSLYQYMFTNSVVLENPQLLANGLFWASRMNVMKNNDANDWKFLTEIAKSAAGSQDLGLRNAGLALIGSIHLYSEDAPVPQRAAPSPSSAAVATASSAQVRGNVTRSAVHDETYLASEDDMANLAAPSDAVAPVNRVDLSPQITEQLLTEMDDKNWKVRAEALAKLQNIVNDVKHIGPSLGDAPPVIAARISDSNSKLASSAISLVGSLAEAMGPPFKQYIRIFLPPILKAIGDSKNWVKAPAVSVINIFGNIGAYKEFFEGEMIADALKSGSPALRSELYNWLAQKLVNIPAKTIAKEELTACLPALYANLEDRNADVRKYANEAVLGFMIHLGYNNMHSAVDTIKGQGGGQVKQILEKTRGNLPERPALLKPRAQSASAAVGKGKVAVVKMFAGSSATITKSKAKSPNSSVRPDQRRDEEADGSELLKVNNMKMQRLIDEQKLKTLKWNFVTPRAEYFELLRDMMTQACLNKNLVSNFFHADFKFHLKAIDSLSEDLNGNLQGLISNLDLILKWMTLRFFDTNTSVINRGLEYLNSAFVLLKNENYAMVDHEASSFIPYLILKAGDAKETTQKSVKDLFVRLSNVYPPNKVSVFLVDGMKTKNSRQRMVCLEIMLKFIENYGVSECYPSLPNFTNVILTFLRDRDQAVRNMAFKIMVSVYIQEGDRFVATVNQVLGKEAPQVITKLKNSARNRPVASVRPMSRPGDSHNVTETHVESEEIEEEEDETVVQEEVRPAPGAMAYSPSPPRLAPSRRSPEPTNYKYELDKHIVELVDRSPLVVNPPNITNIDLQFLKDANAPPSVRAIQMPKVTATLSNFAHPTAIKYEIVQIASSDIEKAISSMNQIDTLLTSEKRAHVLSYVDNIVSQIVHQLIILSQSAHPEVVNCYHAIFNVMHQICNHQDTCGQIRETTLQKILEQFLQLLTEKKLENFEKYEMFLRVVNSTVVHMLTNANKTQILCAVIKLLYNTVDNPTRSKHYQELIVKCLWKLNRAQPQWDSELDYSRILSEIHNFLKDYPSVWWKTQPADVPLRAVKTLLHTMVRLRGTRVRDTVGHLNIPEDSELGMYVKKLIKHLKIEENHSILNANSVKEDSKGVQTRSVPRLTKEAQEELSQIFRMIGDTEESSEGIRRLSVFTKSHPEADVQPFLSKSTSVFQQYIKKGLDSLENQNDQPVKMKTSDIAEHCNKLTENKEEFSQEAQRLWSRLSKLQEKAGCSSSKKGDGQQEVDSNNDFKEFDLR